MPTHPAQFAPSAPITTRAVPFHCQDALIVPLERMVRQQALQEKDNALLAKRAIMVWRLESRLQLMVAQDALQENGQLPLLSAPLLDAIHAIKELTM